MKDMKKLGEGAKISQLAPLLFHVFHAFMFSC